MTTFVNNNNFEDLCTKKYPNIALIKTLTNKTLICRLDFNKTTVNNILQNLVDKIGYKASNVDINQINFIHNKIKWYDREKTLHNLGCSDNLAELNMFYNNTKINPNKKKINLDEVKQKINSSTKIVKVKTLTGKVLHIKFIGELTCEELKLLIMVKIGMPVDQQRIIFRGIQLEDNRMLKDYDIKNEDYVHLVSRLRGGMFHETSGKNGSYKQLEFTIIDIDSDDNLNEQI